MWKIARCVVEKGTVSIRALETVCKNSFFLKHFTFALVLVHKSFRVCLIYSCTSTLNKVYFQQNMTLSLQQGVL